MLSCRFIFISIPRNASSSIHYLLGLVGPKDISRSDDIGIMDNHALSSVVLGRYGREEFERRFKFCFVRNPWDRCVSWFFYHVKEPPYHGCSFKDWIKAGMPHHWKVQNGTKFSEKFSPLEQHLFIADSSGKLMVDFVGRIERFQEDFERVVRKTGVQPIKKDAHINPAKFRKSADYRNYYDDETAEIVGKRLATDVRMFDYSF